MKLGPRALETMTGLCLDNPSSSTNRNEMANVSKKLGTGRQGKATVIVLRDSLVPVSEWRKRHPFTTKRKLTETETKLIRAYVKNPTFTGSAADADLSTRVASRRWNDIYDALGVKSRPAALTASYLLGYWE